MARNRKPVEHNSRYISRSAARLVDDGTLLIKLQGKRLLVSPWAQGANWFRFDGERWTPLQQDPGLRLVMEAYLSRLSHPVRHYLEQIPESVYRYLTGFVAWQPSLMRLLARFPAARELAESTPLLPWLIAAFFDLGTVGTRLASDLLSRRQHEILSEITGLDCTPAHIRFLRKISIIKGDSSELEQIHLALQRPEIQRHCQHLKAVSLSALRSFWQYPFLLELPLLGPALGSYRIGSTSICDMARDTYIMMTHFEDDESARRMLRRCRSKASLMRLHDTYMHLFDLRLMLRQEQRRDHPGQAIPEPDLEQPYPDPILPGNDQIVPIRTPKELWEESTAMKHCVVTRHWDVANGKVSIYRVMAPQRCTLEVIRQDGKISLGDFRTACNGEPSPAARRMVEHWFERSLWVEGKSVNLESARHRNPRTPDVLAPGQNPAGARGHALRRRCLDDRPEQIPGQARD